MERQDSPRRPEWEKEDFLSSPPIPPRRRRPVPIPGESLVVPNPEITEVMETETGEHQPVAQVIGSDYAEAVKTRLQVRAAMHAEEPLYRCSKCFVPVYLCRHPLSTKFYFKHREENGNCPAITRGELSQRDIDALKYNGAKESRLHRKMKDWIEACLHADGRFSDIEKEPTWKGPITGDIRRPDVRARYNGIPIAFEIQLSTTYLDVIVGRRQFYLQEGGLLFWIFAMFDAEHRRMTEDDVFYNNNQNAFVVDSKTVEASLSSHTFMLECVWAMPTPQGGTSSLFRKMAPFHELTLDLPNQRAFYYDFDGKRSELEQSAETECQAIRRELDEWWGRPERYAQDSRADWRRFALRLRKQHVQAPFELGGLESFLTCLYSAKHGKPHGRRHKKLVEIAHRVVGAYPRHLIWFMHAVRTYGRLEAMEQEGEPAKWAKKYKAARDAYKKAPDKFASPQEYRGLVEFLFPELAPLP